MNDRAEESALAISGLTLDELAATGTAPGAAMQAFADKIDGYLLSLEKDVTNRVDHAKGAITVADIIAARKFLVDAKAPSTERRFVYGSQAEADLLNTEAFTNASAVGDNGTALKEASLGRKYGLDFYCDQNV